MFFKVPPGECQAHCNSCELLKVQNLPWKGEFDISDECKWFDVSTRTSHGSVSSAEKNRKYFIIRGHLNCRSSLNDILNSAIITSIWFHGYNFLKYLAVGMMQQKVHLVVWHQLPVAGVGRLLQGFWFVRTDTSCLIEVVFRDEVFWMILHTMALHLWEAWRLELWMGGAISSTNRCLPMSEDILHYSCPLCHMPLAPNRDLTEGITATAYEFCLLHVLKQNKTVDSPSSTGKGLSFIHFHKQHTTP